MIHTIENDYLRVSVDDHGAELCSIFDKVHNREVIWQADPAYWKRHAPVLFPNVGRHFEDHYRINGVEYPSTSSFSREPLFTPTRMGIPRSFATSTTALIRSVLPIFPGLIRILSAPFSMAAIARR